VDPLTRAEVLKGIGAAALFAALVALGLMLSDIGGEQDHRTSGEAADAVVLPLVPQVPWR
jgi:hypothetical protein